METWSDLTTARRHRLILLLQILFVLKTEQPCLVLFWCLTHRKKNVSIKDWWSQEEMPGPWLPEDPDCRTWSACNHMVLANPLPSRRLHRPGGESFARFIKGVKSILARRDNPVLALTTLWPFLKPPSHSLPYFHLQSYLLAWSCLCVSTVYFGGLPVVPVCIYSVLWGFTNGACVYLQCTLGVYQWYLHLQCTLGGYQWCLCVSTVYLGVLPMVPVCMYSVLWGFTNGAYIYSVPWGFTNGAYIYSVPWGFTNGAYIYSVPWGFTNGACVYLQCTLGVYQWCLCVSTVYLRGLPMVPVCIYSVPWGFTNGACVYLQSTLGVY